MAWGLAWALLKYWYLSRIFRGFIEKFFGNVRKPEALCSVWLLERLVNSVLIRSLSVGSNNLWSLCSTRNCVTTTTSRNTPSKSECAVSVELQIVAGSSRLLEYLELMWVRCFWVGKGGAFLINSLYYCWHFRYFKFSLLYSYGVYYWI